MIAQKADCFISICHGNFAWTGKWVGTWNFYLEQCEVLCLIKREKYSQSKDERLKTKNETYYWLCFCLTRGVWINIDEDDFRESADLFVKLQNQ